MLSLLGGLMYDLTKQDGEIYLFASSGRGINELDAFDAAEVNAGIFALNAVRFSSFVPIGPNGRWRLQSELSYSIDRGNSLPMAYADYSSNSEQVAAALAVGIPKDDTLPGIIMEYADKGNSNDLLEKAITSVESTFKRRKWDLKNIETKSVEIIPENGYACAMVGALYLPYDQLLL